jgi:hypothetical protein
LGDRDLAKAAAVERLARGSGSSLAVRYSHRRRAVLDRVTEIFSILPV